MWELLAQKATERGIQLPPGVLTDYKKYFALLTDANKRINLTRITDTKEAIVKHFLDSLELLVWNTSPPAPVLDLGSGAGFPGIPLKIARPEMPVVLLDSSEKRVHFLRQVITELSLQGATAVHGRAEDLARLNKYREAFGLVVSRAVARLNILLEIAIPFVSLGGYFVAYKGPEAMDEVSEAEKALQELGANVLLCHGYRLPEGMGERNLVIVVREKPLPEKYPRKAGMPAKKPL